MLTRMKYGLLRLLGVVSPSGRYATPPRWALNATGRHRFYDAPDCTGDCCPWNRPPARCQLACCNQPLDDCPPDCEADCCGPLVVSAGSLPLLDRCAPASATVDAGATGTLEGRERGDSTC